MCGIVAYTGTQSALPILLDGLKRLEYRGYDSAGVSLISAKSIKKVPKKTSAKISNKDSTKHNNKLITTKAAGKLNHLEAKVDSKFQSSCGIGHTRWATHGAPTDINAHPHTDANNRFAIVHNGIIENVDSLKATLCATHSANSKSATKATSNQKSSTPVAFESETDSEVIAHLIAAHVEAAPECELVDAVRAVLSTIVGTYGLAVIDQQDPRTIVVARNGSPVILGIGDGEMFAASDMSAMIRHTNQIVHLDDGEIAVIRPDGFSVMRLDSSVANKESITLDEQVSSYDKGGHPHYLYREIVDQPQSIGQTLSGRLDERFSTAHLGGLNLEARDLIGIKRITILGCGSALYAGMAGANMIESLARIPTTAESAAEFRYRNPVIEQDTLYIVVSQSGETFDTLAALREVKRKGGVVLGIINSVGSTIAREVNGGIYMHAGPEVSVASTKGYTSMLVTFSLLALLLGRSRDVSPQRGTGIIKELKQLPEHVQSVLALEKAIKKIAQKYKQSQSAFFIGRTTGFPIALEAAQKLKEISYIHAEAYPASELKHGPLALITPSTPCFIVLPDDELLPKTISSMEEINARGGPVIAFTNVPADRSERISKLAKAVIHVPNTGEISQSVVLGVAFQLLAYHSALSLGRDVDQPRNLAKSVTVE